MLESKIFGLTAQRLLSSINKHWQRNVKDFIASRAPQTSLNHHLLILSLRRHLCMAVVKEQILKSLLIQPQCNWEKFISDRINSSRIFSFTIVTVLVKRSLLQLVVFQVQQKYGRYLMDNLSIKFKWEVEIRSILWLLLQIKETNHQNSEETAKIIIWLTFLQTTESLVFMERLIQEFKN